MTYKIIRFYQKSTKRVVKRGLTLAEAQAHCGSPETASSTATSSKARQRTRKKGAWFDGYDRE